MSFVERLPLFHIVHNQRFHCISVHTLHFQCCTYVHCTSSAAHTYIALPVLYVRTLHFLCCTYVHCTSSVVRTYIALPVLYVRTLHFQCCTYVHCTSSAVHEVLVLLCSIVLGCVLVLFGFLTICSQTKALELLDMVPSDPN